MLFVFFVTKPIALSTGEIFRLMVRINLKILSIVMMAFMMVSCNLFDKDCRAIMGEYVSNDYQTLTDGIPCDVTLETSENFEHEAGFSLR